jgi:PKD repeat protein
MHRGTTLLSIGLLLLFSACDSGPAPNEPPTADFSYSPASPRAGESVSFTVNATDTDGEIESYSWDFDGDGSQDASSPSPTYSFSSSGNFTVTLTVTDDRGDTDTATQSVSVAQRFTEVTVTSVTVEDVPFSTQNGEGWDVSTGPELYYEAVNSSDIQVAVSGYYTDVGPANLPLPYEDQEFSIDDFSEEYRIFLWDFDSSNDDELIGGIVFTIDGLNIVGNYPETATLDAGGIQMELDLDWQE